MMLIQPRHILIYNIFTIILSAFVIFGGTQCGVNAIEYGSVHYDKKESSINYSAFDRDKTQKYADLFFNRAMKSKDEAFKKELLNEAAGQYYILSRIEPNDLDTLIQLGRIYDYDRKNNYSKSYFYRALEINKNYAPANYYFGDYYYSRKDYKKALYYYEKAFKNGYKANYDVLIKMATIYEKLGDLLKANQYYKKAFLAKKDKSEIADKIREMEDLNYKDTGYYNKRRKKDSTK